MISLEYTRAIAEAQKLENAAESCGKALTLIKKEIAESGSFWIGKSGDAMRSRLQESYADISKVKANFEEIAASIRKAAAEIKNKDASLAAGIAMRNFI